MVARPFALKPMHRAIQWSIAWMGNTPIATMDVVVIGMRLGRSLISGGTTFTTLSLIIVHDSVLLVVVEDIEEDYKFIVVLAGHR